HEHTNPFTSSIDDHKHGNPNTGSESSHTHPKQTMGAPTTLCTVGEGDVEPVAAPYHEHNLTSSQPGSSHSHSIGDTDGEGGHGHTQGNTGSKTDSISDIRPKYYKLAYIMK
ncbi:unnamed protein product, partial [marine sediment metagenome]